LIGPVGSGKSLFIKRYHRFLQPEEQQSHVIWSYLDFNKAPDDLSGIESWVCQEFIGGVSNANPALDIYSIAMLRQIFAPDINKRERGAYAPLRESVPSEYNRMLTQDLKEWVDNELKLAMSLCRYLIGVRRIPVIVAFDNVDRRDREQQLRIFQVAQWFKNGTRAFCLLTLR
jgi:GTPase SAR1 family protein